MKNDDPRLFSYRMTFDTGFAPNPFHGFLTLACCMAGIRSTKKVGDWVAGFTSKELNRKFKKDCEGLAAADERLEDDLRLIYLMRISDIISFTDYWKQYECKKCKKSSDDPKYRAGDNIYKPKSNINHSVNPTDFERQPNHNHNNWELQKQDIDGKSVLISKDFYYFGSSAIPIPPDKEKGPKIPPSQANYGFKTDPKKAQKFIDYVKDYVNSKFKRHNYPTGIYGWPHKWPCDEKNIPALANPKSKKIKKSC